MTRGSILARGGERQKLDIAMLGVPLQCSHASETDDKAKDSQSWKTAQEALGVKSNLNGKLTDSIPPLYLTLDLAVGIAKGVWARITHGYLTAGSLVIIIVYYRDSR
jgi:hypothetical protein